MRIFDDRFMKYWYFVAIVIVAAFVTSMGNNSSVQGYELTVYNPNGTVEYKKDIVAPTIPEKDLEMLPVSKSFTPKKRF